MYASAIAVAALIGSAAAFAPPTAASATVVTRSSTALRAGYVPDGLTEAEWEAAKATRAKAAEDRKKKFANKTFEDFTEWMLERDAKYPGQPGAGHRMAKVQDRAQKNPRASSFLSGQQQN